MDTIFLGNEDQKNLVGSKLTKFCSLCGKGMAGGVHSGVTRELFIPSSEDNARRQHTHLISICISLYKNLCTRLTYMLRGEYSIYKIWFMVALS